MPITSTSWVPVLGPGPNCNKRVQKLYYILLAMGALSFPTFCSASKDRYLDLPALGRVAQLGFLYDERTDQFRSVSVFKHDISNESITETQQLPLELETIQTGITNTLADTFDLFDIDTNTGINILAGLTNVKGSASILKHKGPMTTTTGTLLYKFQTIVQNLQIHQEDLLPSFNMDVLSHKGATHLVTGITWGSSVALTLEEASTLNQTKIQQVIRTFLAEYQKFKIHGPLYSTIGASEEMEKLENVTISIKSDIPLPNYSGLSRSGPATHEGIHNLLDQVREVVGAVNDGKGVPLDFTLTPLSHVRSYLKLDTVANTSSSVPPQKLNDYTLKRLINIYDDFALSHQRINELREQFLRQNYWHCVPQETTHKVEVLQEGLDESKSMLTRTLTYALVDVRSRSKPATDLSFIAQIYENGNFTSKSIDIKAGDFEFTNARAKLEFCTKLERSAPSITYFGSRRDLMYQLGFFEHHDHELDQPVFILFTKTKFAQKNPDLYSEHVDRIVDTLYKPMFVLYLVDCDFGHQPFCSNLTELSVGRYHNGQLTLMNVTSMTQRREAPAWSCQQQMFLLQNMIQSLMSQNTQIIQEVSGLNQRLNVSARIEEGAGCECNNCELQGALQSNKTREIISDSNTILFCNNGGTITNSHGQSFCTCPMGFVGVHCQINAERCTRFEGCFNGGTCEVGGNSSTHCLCKEGFSGENCQNQDQVNTCPAAESLSRNQLEVVSVSCNGLIPMSGLLSRTSFLLDYRSSMTYQNKENCLWTMDSVSNGKQYHLKVRVTLLCEGFLDNGGSLSVVDMKYKRGHGRDWNLSRRELKAANGNYTSNDWDYKLFLNFISEGNVSGSGFLMQIDVLDIRQEGTGSNVIHTTSPGAGSFGPFTRVDFFSLVVNPHLMRGMRTTLTVNYMGFQSMRGNVLSDKLDVYEIPPKNSPTRLGRWNTNVTSPVSFTSEYPFIATFHTSASTAGRGFQISWK